MAGAQESLRTGHVHQLGKLLQGLTTAPLPLLSSNKNLLPPRLKVKKKSYMLSETTPFHTGGALQPRRLEKKRERLKEKGRETEIVRLSTCLLF